MNVVGDNDLERFVRGWELNRSLLRKYPAAQESVDHIVEWVRKHAKKKGELRSERFG